MTFFYLLEVLFGISGRFLVSLYILPGRWVGFYLFLSIDVGYTWDLTSAHGVIIHYLLLLLPPYSFIQMPLSSHCKRSILHIMPFINMPPQIPTKKLLFIYTVSLKQRVIRSSSQIAFILLFRHLFWFLFGLRGILLLWCCC